MTLSWTFSAVTLVHRVRWSQEHFILSNFITIWILISFPSLSPAPPQSTVPLVYPCSFQVSPVLPQNRSAPCAKLRLPTARSKSVTTAWTGIVATFKDPWLASLHSLRNSSYKTWVIIFFSVLKSYIFFLHRVTHFPIYRVIYFSFFRAVYFLFLKVIIFLCYALVYFPLCRPGGFRVDEHVFSFHFMNIIMV